MKELPASVGVVVCTYSDARFSLLRRAVDSVLAQSLPPDEVVVVVDHNPVLRDAVRAAYPYLQVVENRSVHGVSGARNTGVEELTTDLVAFLDDDARAGADWLSALVAVLGDPKLLGADSHIEPEWEVPRPRWFPDEFLWVVGCSYRGLPRAIGPVRNLIGAAMVLRRDVFVELGGFRSVLGRVNTFPIGCEETEFGIRISRAHSDRVLVHDPDARAYHNVTPERATLRYFLARCFAEGRSKALMTQFVGSTSGLSSEWTYVRRTVPTGVARALARGRLGRAAVLVGGVLVTTAGYVYGRLVTGDATLVTTPQHPLVPSEWHRG